MMNISRLRPDVGVPLCNATLPLHSDRLLVPRYDRSALVPSVVHIGVGGFHRAHQAVYLDELARNGVSQGWGLTGVGARREPADYPSWVPSRSTPRLRSRRCGHLCFELNKRRRR